MHNTLRNHRKTIRRLVLEMVVLDMDTGPSPHSITDPATIGDPKYRPSLSPFEWNSEILYKKEKQEKNLKNKKNLRGSLTGMSCIFYCSQNDRVHIYMYISL